MGMIFKCCECCGKTVSENVNLRIAIIREGDRNINKMVCESCFNIKLNEETLLEG